MRRPAKSRLKHRVEHPELAVVMATHNGERYLKRSIESILGQTFRAFKFVIIDDFSRDPTPTILDRLAAKDPRIEIIRNDEQMGLAASLNRGIAFANAPFIARMDDDDIAEPDRLEKQLRFLKTNRDYALVGSNFSIIDKHGCVKGVVRLPRTDAAIRSSLLRRNPLCHPSVMFCKSALIAVKGYDPSFKTSQDYELWFRFFSQGRSYNIQKSLVRRRVHAGTVSIRHKGLQVYNTLRIHAIYWRKGFLKVNFYLGVLLPIFGLFRHYVFVRLQRVWKQWLS